LTKVVEFYEWLCSYVIKAVPLRHLELGNPKIPDKDLLFALVENTEGRLVCQGNFITTCCGGVVFYSGRGQGCEDNLKRFVEAMSIRVITACPAGISEKFGQTPPERPD
jgi:hypothetical protein